ncbi:phosphoglycerate mutase [Cochleicola gelatinilyticus]|uniref:Phosphoglycerate mutase n=1 Tax=Cochleicola gelatinilyticus TaxID=1763537 RepID=A0A167HVI1_9FLAO|nr:phosphoglycerate mutase [Cochleicola gelatinilyticus]
MTSCNSQHKKDDVGVKEELMETTYYLIRHAEKDRSDPSNSNPALSKTGVERAKSWSEYFKDIPLNAIYSTNLTRTQQTASYTASEKSINVQTYDPTNLYNKTFKDDTAGKKVLIVGHSNTTPFFVNKIIGESKYKDIPDNENGMLYIVTIVGDEKEVAIKTIN